jgi:hypothetical protein
MPPSDAPNAFSVARISRPVGMLKKVLGRPVSRTVFQGKLADLPGAGDAAICIAINVAAVGPRQGGRSRLASAGMTSPWSSVSANAAIKRQWSGGWVASFPECCFKDSWCRDRFAAPQKQEADTSIYTFVVREPHQNT